MWGQYKLNPLGKNLETRVYDVDSSHSETIYPGDALTLESNGNAIKARGDGTPANAVAIVGVAQAMYDSSGSQENAFTKALANGSSGEVSVIIDPMATFMITCSGSTSLTQTHIGNSANLAQSGNQTLDLDTVSSTETRQFFIIDTYTDPNSTKWAIVRPKKHMQLTDAGI